MDIKRLANVIFDRGQKIPQTRYAMICEAIKSDQFTLDEYVLAYKSKEKFLNKIAYKLNDGTNVIISESTVQKLNSLNINTNELEKFMSENYSNFKKVIGIVANGNH